VAPVTQITSSEPETLAEMRSAGGTGDDSVVFSELEAFKEISGADGIGDTCVVFSGLEAGVGEVAGAHERLFLV